MTPLRRIAFENLVQPNGCWVFAGLMVKGRRVRTVSVPAWVKVRFQGIFRRAMAEPLRKSQDDPRIAELEAYAQDVFGNAAVAFRWLDTDLWELGNISPRSIVFRAGQAGLEQARDVLLRIEYGVYS